LKPLSLQQPSSNNCENAKKNNKMTGTTNDESEHDSKNTTVGSTVRTSHGTGMNSSIFRFKDINFVVPVKGGDKVILQNVSGTVKWGHVLAIMGPSGAGKV
jgi:ATP-binding cassette, subfamily G (WHITE), member 2, SNQ2